MKSIACLHVPAAGVLLAQLTLTSPALAGGIIGAGAADLMIDGPPNAGFAESAAIVPDLDGDGVDDFAVGAIAFDPLDDFGFPINNAGGVMVFSGETGLPIRAFEGFEPNGNLGFAIITLPDRNGDGTYELAVGAPRMSNGGVSEAGAVVIFSGATGDVLDTIYGQAGQGTLFGTSLALIGDLTGDGVPEFVGGASGVGVTNPASPGFAVVFNGDTLLPMDILSGEEPGAIFGASVAGGGDLNGDSVPDFVVGAPLQDINGGPGGSSIDAGRIYAYSGADFSELHAIQHQGGVETPMANFGTSVAVIGDINGDGNADFAAGGPESQQGSGGNGFVAVYSGDNGQLLHDIDGAFVTGEQHGTDVIGTGDVDGDGVPDFAATSSQTCFGFCSSGPGEVIVYSGATGDPISVYEGEGNGDNFGAALAAADLDGDGGVELVAGAPFHGFGRAYLFRGEGTVACSSDLDGSGDVGFGDILVLIGAWGPCAACPEDLDGSGDVGFGDILAVIGDWGACP
jgi:hypothetical protein